MNPVEFKEQNVVYGTEEPEYLPLPALKFPSPKGEVISCWRLTFLERIKILFTGRIWQSLYSFNQPLTPSRLSVNKNEMFTVENHNQEK